MDLKEFESIDIFPTRIHVAKNFLDKEEFDKLEKLVQEDKKHLDIRMNALKFGTMKTDKARSAWDFWKTTRDQDFINWFESEIYGEGQLDADELLEQTKGGSFKASIR